MNTARVTTRLLVDTDIGSDIDDSLALLALLHMPGVDLCAVTTVYGCVDLRAKLARKILLAAGRDIPVGAGASVPLSKRPPVWLTGHEGEGALSPEEVDAPLAAFGITQDAVELIVQSAIEAPEQLTLLCIGPLTNIAKALTIDPRLPRLVKAVYLMGGGITFGKRKTPPEIEPGIKYVAAPSHNISSDLRAARQVFASDFRLHVVTNDVTTRLTWKEPAMEEVLTAQEPPETVVVADLLRVWLDYRSQLFRCRVSATCPHDSLAAAEACGLGFVSYVPGEMEILCDGATSFRACHDGRHKAAVLVDAEAFLCWFSYVLFGPAKRPPPKHLP